MELTKLREVYARVARNSRFSVHIRDKEYTRFVVSVTFLYAVKEYNRLRKGCYVKLGYDLSDIEFKDCLCMDGDTLLGIRVDTPVESPVDDSVLAPYFYFKDGCYHAKPNIKTVYNVRELRNQIYEKGFWLDGIHFVRWKRSAGSARVGKCLFIAEQLYPQMHKWELCGLKIRNGDAIDLAAFESYISLTMSSSISELEINPQNILVIDDYESVFKDTVVNVSAVDNKLVAQEKEVEIRNSIWDGQALIDPSLMKGYSRYGFVLLRNRFFKSAAFNFNIQQFFEDHGITDVSQLNGFTKATDIHDVKFITTPSSIKYCKFGTVEEWLNNVDPIFSIVKHEKKTHFMDGRLVQSHYQLLNTLQMSIEDVNEFLSPTFEYLRLLKSNPSVMRYHIHYNYTANTEIDAAPTKSDIVYRMLGITDEFVNTKLYNGFKHDVIAAFVKSLKTGHVMINGNYSTLCGNPVEMALSAIGAFDGESIMGAGNVYSTRFAFDKRLLGSRSPHVTMGNVWITNNRYNELIDRYVNITPEIIVVNSIKENLLSRLSGADFDSDTSLITDNECLIRAAEKNYDLFKVPTMGDIPSTKKKRHFTQQDKADLDFRTSENSIGIIVNQSQELNTLIWDSINHGKSFEDIRDIYYDASLLDVLSNVEIDRAKREFSINTAFEVKRIKDKYSKTDKDGRMIKPNFFGHVARQKGYYNSERKNYKHHRTTMDFLQKCVNRQSRVRVPRQIVPFSSILIDTSAHNRVNHDQARRVLDIIRQSRKNVKEIWNMPPELLTNAEKAATSARIRQDASEDICNIRMSTATMRYLLLQIEAPANADVARTIFFGLFGTPSESFFELIRESQTPIAMLEPDEDGNICLYGERYSCVPYMKLPFDELPESPQI